MRGVERSALSNSAGETDMLEPSINQKLRALLGRHELAPTPEQWAALREGWRLPLLYAGQYVAFRDHFVGEGERRRFGRREIVRTSRSLVALSKFVDRLPKGEQRGV